MSGFVINSGNRGKNIVTRSLLLPNTSQITLFNHHARQAPAVLAGWVLVSHFDAPQMKGAARRNRHHPFAVLAIAPKAEAYIIGKT
jgi:hypothetical protein